MKQVDLVLLHPPSVYEFRDLPIFHGPISDVIPSSSIFENYPIGFLTLSEYLCRNGITVRIVNLALKMLEDFSFDPESFVAKLHPVAFGIDLHWLPHVDGSLRLAEAVKRRHPDTPVIFGGLSSTYYHQEIMRDCPSVDFIGPRRFDRRAIAAPHESHQVRWGVREGAEPRVAERAGRGHGERDLQPPPRSRLRALRLFASDQDDHEIP